MDRRTDRVFVSNHRNAFVSTNIRLNYETWAYLGTPDTCDSISRMEAFSVAHSSISFQSSGRRSLTFVCQSNVFTPEGRGVTFRPCAKSSIRMPTEPVTNAFEHDARLNNVYIIRNINIPPLAENEKTRLRYKLIAIFRALSKPFQLYLPLRAYDCN